MKYITIIINFVTLYDYVILPAISVSLALFCIVNFCKNVYRKQNKKILAATRKVCSYPDKTAQYVNALPAEYRRQWRAYVNGNANQPSDTFEFAPVKNRLRLIRLFVLTAIVCALYLVAFVFDVRRTDYLIFQIMFWLAFALIVIADWQLFKLRERKAKRIFARFVNELNRTACKTDKTESKSEDTVKELRELNKCEPTKAVFERAATLLRNKGLDGERTVDQQRKLNDALNGLLQSYTKAAD